MLQLIKSIYEIFYNRNSVYKPFNANQFKLSIDEAAVNQTVRQFNKAAKEVCIGKKK